MNIWELIIVQPMTNILLFITMLVKNFGVAIILFTLLIKLLTIPLTAKQVKSRREMAELQNDPQYKKIMEKYKDDREKLALEQQRIYKEKGISPFSSCLPLLLLKLERLIYPFLDVSKIIPIQNRFLWMDLGQPERLNVFGVGIPVLAILVFVTSWLQSKAMAAPDAGGDPSMAATTNSMNVMMPLFMGYLAYQYSAGLALYFVISNLSTMLIYALMGEMNLKNLNPFKKEKTTEPAKKVVDSTLINNGENDMPEKQSEKTHVKPSARSSAKRMRPKKKKD